MIKPTLSLTLLCAMGAIAAAPAMAIDGPTIAVPANLQSAATQGSAIELRARGVQIYVCKESAAKPGQFEWNFVAPEAELFDASGALVGKHFAGPTWQSRDGSQVVAEVAARADAPTANAIPWLLLKAKSHAGSGAFAQVGAIQRLATEAGKAPVEGCKHEQAGSEIRVPYQAIYRLYSAN